MLETIAIIVSIFLIVAIFRAVFLLAEEYEKEKNEEIIERRKMDKLI